MNVIIKFLLLSKILFDSFTNGGNCLPEGIYEYVIDRNIPCCSSKSTEDNNIYRPYCGWQMDRTSRIYGNHNNECYLGEFPWMSLIFYKRLNTSDCSGAIFHDKFILTAAHCITGPILRSSGYP